MKINNLQTLGGAAALLMAATFVVAFSVFLGVLMPAGYFEDGIIPADKVRIIVDNATFVTIGYLIPYVGWGFLQVVLVLALYDRLKVRVPVLAQVSAVIGLIWAVIIIASGLIFTLGIRVAVDLASVDLAQAATVWAAIEIVGNALGGEAWEIVGGVWLLLIGWAALRARQLPRALSYWTLGLGVAAIFTIIPPISLPLAALYGIGLIVWFIWLGVFMLRRGLNDMVQT